jgi:capsular polysaccharide biosynthesis protein
VELRDYARAIAGRWVWAVAAGAVAVLLAIVIWSLTPTGYEARVTLYVDAAVIADPQDPSSAAEVRMTVLPSVAALASSSSVLTRVAGTLGLPDSPAALADGLDVAIEDDTSVLHLSATRSTPAEAAAVAQAVGAELQRRAGSLFAGTDGPLLRVTPVRDAAAPVPTSRPVAVLAALGAVAGAGAGGLLAGLAELARPRVRGRRDVFRLTSAPVLGVLPGADPAGRRSARWLRRTGASPQRAEELARLRWTVRSTSGDEAGRRVALVGAATATASLAGELTGPGLDVVALDSPGELPAAGHFDGVVVVADGRRTTVPVLAATLEATRSSGVPLTGVVVDGLLPPGAPWRARLRAGSRGDATWWLDSRSGSGSAGPIRRRAPVATQVVAALAVAMVGFTRPLPLGLSAGLLAAGALLPLWLPVVRRSRGLTLLLVLAGVGLLSGVLLAWSLADDHEFALHEAVVQASTVLGALGGVGVLVWARAALPIPALGAVFGLAMLLTSAIGAAGTENVWKFQLSSPLMVIGLSLAVHWGKPVRTLAVLAVLGLLNVTNDSRSAFGFCLVAAALVLWQQRPVRTGARHPGRRWLALPAIGVLGAGGYSLLTQLILAGALGAEIQQRSAVQIAQSGSLLLGGRPEWTATWALMHTHPFGFGLGTVPNGEDVLVGKAGIAVTNIPTAEAYLENYMLDGGVQLHSIVADLWAALGPAGVLLGLAMGALVVRGLAAQLARRQASGLVCLLVPMALWGLPFAPIASNVDTLTLALGLLLLTRRPGSSAAGGGRLDVAAGPGRAALPRRLLVAT